MTTEKGTPQRVVVDGSNLATEGRSLPSLAQLDEAVRSFREEHVDDDIIVVVDASFSYRIDESERQILEDAEEAGEIVSPPAGAIGRGDGFLLRIADRTGAVVLSNDSFQEFHGEYKWLFEEGRLIGGKPVPGVGWIFTPRTPVRGPKSRVAVRDAERAKRRTSTRKVEEPVAEAIAEATAQAIAPDAPSRKRGRSRGTSTPSPDAVNDPLPFITFIANHRLGSEVEGVVDSFTSHGAFVNADGARCYAPVVGLGDPAPRSAKEVLTRGETRTFVVQALDPPRRGIELALPGLARLAGKPTEETVEAEIDEIEDTPAPTRTRRRTVAEVPAAEETPAADGTPAENAAEEAASDGVAPKRAAGRTRKRAAAVPVRPVEAGDGAEGVTAESGDVAAPAPAKRSRRGVAKKAALEESVAPAVSDEADVAAVAAGPGSVPAGEAKATASRRRTAKKAQATVSDGPTTVSDGPTPGADEAQPADVGADVPVDETPAMKRPSTRSASKRTPAAEKAVPDPSGGAGPPSAPRRTRKATAPVADASEAVPPSPVTPPGESESAAPARPGPRRSTIKKAATTAGAPVRGVPAGDPDAPARSGRRRRPSTAGTDSTPRPTPEPSPTDTPAEPVAKAATAPKTKTVAKATKATKASKVTKATKAKKAKKVAKVANATKVAKVAKAGTGTKAGGSKKAAKVAKKAGGTT